MARSAAADVDLRGGNPAIDLVNTVAWRGDPRRRTDYLAEYRDVLAWARHAGVLTAREERTLADRAASDGDAAAKALRDTRRFREALHGAWTGQRSARDADRIADTYRAALRARRLAVDGEVGRWHDCALTVRTPLYRLAVEAVALLTAVPFSRIRGCGDPACGWLFLDASHRQNRRWCSTADCGNRARVRSFYRRNRGTSPG